MEGDNTPDQNKHKATEGLFTEKQVGAAAVLAGPLSGGILVYLTFKRMGESKKASMALLGTIVFTLVLLGIIMSLPAEWSSNMINTIVTAVVGVSVYMVYHTHLESNVKQAISGGAPVGSNWTVAGISVMGFTVTMAAIVMLSLALPPFEGEVFESGPAGDQIYYDEGTATDEELRLVSDLLTEGGYFGFEDQMFVRLENGPANCTLVMPVAEKVWNDPEVLEWGETTRFNLEMTLGVKALVVFEDYKLDGTRIVKTIGP